jgi:hypothetical protein
MRAKRARIEKTLGISNLSELGQQDFLKRLPDDFAYLLEEVDVVGGLSHVFVAHRVRMHQELERGIPMTELPLVLGPAPWDVVNETLKAAEFAYSVVSPLTTKILELYELRNWPKELMNVDWVSRRMLADKWKYRDAEMSNQIRFDISRNCITKIHGQAEYGLKKRICYATPSGLPT